MNIIEIIAQDVFDKVRGRFSNLEMGDENGAVTTDPRNARFFDFDFAIEGNVLGRVSISINELGTLKVFYGQGITEGADSITLGMWYDFLKEMRYFAKRRMLRFDTRDITKGNLNKNDFQYLAQTGTKGNNMNESTMYGSSKTSYRKLENTLLRIRHSKTVDETQRGSRSRNINALFIENEAGERFKYPFIHLAGAKAMQRHVANGGRPYDEAGKAIIGISEKIAQLTAFKRHVGHHDGMNAEVNEIVERSQHKLNDLRKTIEGLSKQGFYQQWMENFQPGAEDGFELDPATVEDYKNKFTVKQFKEDLVQYFPLIHSIMQEAGEIDLSDYVDVQEQAEEPQQVVPASEKDFSQFESWAEEVVESSSEDKFVNSLTPDEKDELMSIAKGNGNVVYDSPLYNKLYDFYTNNGEMPYDVASDGEPDRWMDDAIPKSFGYMTQDEAIDKDNPRDYEVPAYMRKQQGQAPLTMKDIKDKEEKAKRDYHSRAGIGEEAAEQKVSMKEIAEVVKSFYDRESGKFPKGETGVITHIKKQFGEQAGQIAEKFVEQLSQKANQIEQEQVTQQQFEEIKKLAGLAK